MRPRKYSKEQVLEMATLLAINKGYLNITREDVAAMATTSPATVSGMFGSMEQLKQEVIKYAINHECLPVIAQAMSDRNKIALAAPEFLKRRAMEALLT
jgi:AcrR family transcriptional regulator